MSAIIDKIFMQSNDYSKIEQSFVDKTGQRLVSSETEKQEQVEIKSSVSVVIPAYTGNNLLLVLDGLERQSFKKFEVIIVDDCSPTLIKDKIITSKFSYPIKMIRNTTNKGRPVARNIGISAADGDIIIIMDQDMLVASNFVYELVLRQEFTDKCAFLGFRENTEYKDYKKNKKADFKKDWRYEQECDENFIILSPVRNKLKPKNRKYSLLKETNNFKNFGNGKCVGYWDLASMVVSHSLCIKKKSIIESGGFSEGIFKGWGVEDLAFGASLIAHGNYMVPFLSCASYHINHERFSGSRKKEWVEFLKNLNVYFHFVKTPTNKMIFNNHISKKIESIRNIDFFEFE